MKKLLDWLKFGSRLWLALQAQTTCLCRPHRAYGARCSWPLIQKKGAGAHSLASTVLCKSLSWGSLDWVLLHKHCPCCLLFCFCLPFCLLPFSHNGPHQSTPLITQMLADTLTPFHRSLLCSNLDRQQLSLDHCSGPPASSPPCCWWGSPCTVRQFVHHTQLSGAAACPVVLLVCLYGKNNVGSVQRCHIILVV